MTPCRLRTQSSRSSHCRKHVRVEPKQVLRVGAVLHLCEPRQVLSVVQNHGLVGRVGVAVIAVEPVCEALEMRPVLAAPCDVCVRFASLGPSDGGQHVGNSVSLHKCGGVGRHTSDPVAALLEDDLCRAVRVAFESLDQGVHQALQNLGHEAAL